VSKDFVANLERTEVTRVGKAMAGVLQDNQRRLPHEARASHRAQVCDAAAAVTSPSAKSLVIPTVSVPVQSSAQGEHP
jgi:hypothetical protein